MVSLAQSPPRRKNVDLLRNNSSWKPSPAQGSFYLHTAAMSHPFAEIFVSLRLALATFCGADAFTLAFLSILFVFKRSPSDDFNISRQASFSFLY